MIKLIRLEIHNVRESQTLLKWKENIHKGLKLESLMGVCNHKG